MKKSFALLLASGMMFCSINSILAVEQSGSTGTINDRLKDLQTRLQDFHKQTSKKIEAKLNPVVSAEPVIMPAQGFEPIITVDGQTYPLGDSFIELDESKEASMMVLYHDNVISEEKNQLSENEQIQSNNNKPNIEMEYEEVKINSLGDSVYVTSAERKESKPVKASFYDKYSELRKKIIMANSSY